MESNIISAIIGFWRIGADMYQIEGVTGVNQLGIQQIIDSYEETVEYKSFLERVKRIKNNANDFITP